MRWEGVLARHCRDAGVGPAGAFSDGVREDFGGPVCLVRVLGAGAEGLPALVRGGMDWASVDPLDRPGLSWLRRLRAHDEVCFVEKNDVSGWGCILVMKRMEVMTRGRCVMGELDLSMPPVVSEDVVDCSRTEQVG